MFDNEARILIGWYSLASQSERVLTRCILIDDKANPHKPNESKSSIFMIKVGVLHHKAITYILLKSF